MQFKKWFAEETRCKMQLEADDSIGRYIAKKSHDWGVTITEAAERSLARLYNQIQGENTVLILTAFRGERKLAENRAKNRQLAADIRALGWGYTPVLGGFMETDAEGKQNRVHEESFFINANGSAKEVIAEALRLLKKYDQEAALLKLPERQDASLIFTNGEVMSVGKWRADADMMAQFYTRMRSGPPNRQFKFEAAGDDSVMSRYAVDTFFKNK